MLFEFYSLHFYPENSKLMAHAPTNLQFRYELKIKFLKYFFLIFYPKRDNIFNHITINP